MAPVAKLKSQSVGYYRYYTDVILGKGNFATVYLARHKVVGCEVALKVINTDDIEEEYVYRNLSREARILRDLQHPNIVRLYETVKAVNLYCLSLELIRGVNLYHYMMKQEDRKIPEKLARVFFYQMLSAVEYMHRLHVIHRDLKLENILVEFGHVIKIADFGLSNIYYPYLELRTHCGSVEYAAPELFRSTAYGTPADVWSLGVILYAMVVGKMPFMFSREKLECADTSRMRQLFMQRISKGLMQENWELMEGLSPDCWNLLHDLLQPDQYRRIRIEDSLVHHWIMKDDNLKKRLPQKRKDLRRKFHPEIVEYLAHKLNTSKDRIEKHINAYQSDKIACMYYIVRDILVKEVLYPPSLLETSFLYRFQCWIENRNSLFSVLRYQQKNLKEKEKIKSYFSVKSSAACLNKVDDECKMSSSNSSNVKHVADLEMQSSTNTKVLKPFTRYQKKSFKNVNQYVVPEVINIDHISERKVQQNASRNPYRSYKSSRPENFRSHAGSCSESIENNFCVDKMTEMASGLNIDEEIPCSSEKDEVIYPISQHNTPNRKSDNEKKNSPTYAIEKSFTISNSERNKQMKSVTYTKSKHSADKTSSKDGRKFCPAKILTKCSSLVNDSPAVKSNDSVIRKPQVNKRIINNANLRETTSKRIERNCVSLLTRSHGTSNELKTGEIPKVTDHAYTPSRIPMKNMRYGPPAPFSQSIVTSKSKGRKSTEGDRTEHCRGDTIEEVQ